MAPFELFQSIGVALLGLVAVVTAGWFAIVWLRGWMRSDEDGARSFTLDDLRRLHREGELSDEEFQKARDAMIAAAKRSASKAASAEPLVDFGLENKQGPVEVKRTHPPRPPKRPPQLGG